MIKRKRHLDREDRLERAYQRLGTRNPVCRTCGRHDPNHPEIFDLHHIAGKSHEDVFIECSNCHRTLSDQQKDHVPPGSQPVGVLSTIGRYLLGLVDMLAMIIETLRTFGNWLLGEAARKVSP